MNQLEAMQIYMRVGELSSFTEAATRMGLPKSSISTAVQQLESLLGTRLLHRTTRRVQMTQDGQVFYERCRDLLADMDELQTLFQAGPDELDGRLRVDMPMAVARTIIIPRLPEFLRRHPRLEIELSSTDRRVDLVREGFDCVLRVGNVIDAGLIARTLGYYRVINCASPAYVSAFGMPHTLADLAGHRLIHYVSTLGAKSPGFEYVDPATGTTRFMAMQGAVTVNNSEAYHAACLAGLGIVQPPGISMQPLIASGLLVEVLPQYRAEPMRVSLLYANRRHLPKRVHAFMAWVAEVMDAYVIKEPHAL